MQRSRRIELTTLLSGEQVIAIDVGMDFPDSHVRLNGFWVPASWRDKARSLERFLQNAVADDCFGFQWVHLHDVRNFLVPDDDGKGHRVASIIQSGTGAWFAVTDDGTRLPLELNDSFRVRVFVPGYAATKPEEVLVHG